MSQEILQILYMVRNQQITPEEGVKLINALEGEKEKSRNNNAEFVKVKVTGPKGKEKVNVTLPISFLSTGMKLAEKFSSEFSASGLKKSDIEDIIHAVKVGKTGKIIDVQKDDGERVEITIS